MAEERYGGRVLVVDDEPCLLEVLSGFLATQGYAVEVAADRLQALEKARSFRPDLVITNQNMPHGSGFDLAEDLLREGIETRLVLLTGMGRGVTAIGCLQRGFCELLTKPTTTAELAATVRRLIGDADATNRKLRRFSEIAETFLDALARGEGRGVMSTPPSEACGETTLEDAIALAVGAHRGQADKAGAPYVLHPLRVMLRMETDEERMAAVLHDVVEDSEVTLADLTRRGFPAEVVEAVDVLTNDGEDYDACVARVEAHPLARKVKTADLEDNMDIRRMSEPTERDWVRVSKYRRIWGRLVGR